MLTERPSDLGERIGAGRIAHSHGLADTLVALRFSGTLILPEQPL